MPNRHEYIVPRPRDTDNRWLRAKHHPNATCWQTQPPRQWHHSSLQRRRQRHPAAQPPTNAAGRHQAALTLWYALHATHLTSLPSSRCRSSVQKNDETLHRKRAKRNYDPSRQIRSEQVHEPPQHNTPCRNTEVVVASTGVTGAPPPRFPEHLSGPLSPATSTIHSGQCI